MLRFMVILAIAITFVTLTGCGDAPAPTTRPAMEAPATEAPSLKKPIQAAHPPRLIPKQITVIGPNGPQTVTITVPEDDGTATNPGFLPLVPAVPVVPARPVSPNPLPQKQELPPIYG